MKELIKGIGEREKERWGQEKIKEMIPEESPVGEHVGNGMVEKTIQTVNGQTKTMKLGIERRYEQAIDLTHHIWR